MSPRVPDNLARLYEAFGEKAIGGILDGESFVVDGVEFVCSYRPDSTAERFHIVKPMPLIDRYRRLCEEARGGNILELGIAEGGSTALLALWAEPRKLVAVDLEPNSLEALATFLETRNLGDRVVPLYGVDQADRQQLGEIADREFDGPLDLVIDDASHVYELTRTSFETLFPRLRPGGTYVIEDWDAAITMRDAIRATLDDHDNPRRAQAVEAIRRALQEPDREDTRPQTPLCRLALELTLGCASLGDGVADVAMNRYYVAVVRGTAELDPSTFAMADVYTDHFGLLTPEQ